MADMPIGSLVEAVNVQPTDLFVLEQNGVAKHLKGQTLENWLLELAQGRGGILSINKVKTQGLVDTYRITFSDTSYKDYTVTNGNGVVSIVKTSTSQLVDTYTITYTDQTTSTFTVTNGAKGDKGDNTYTWIKYASVDPAQPPHSFGDIPDDWLGIYWGSRNQAPTLWSDYKWYKIRGEQGKVGDAALLDSSTVKYAVSSSGTIPPTGGWQSSIPAVPQGNYLWVQTTLNFNTGNPVTYYSVGRMGIDGSGTVKYVNGKGANTAGEIVLNASDVEALSSKGNGVNSKDIAPQSVLLDKLSLEVQEKLIEAKISIKKLWTNASPRSDFAAQTLNIDFSEYSGILISYYTFGVSVGGAYDAYSEKESSMIFMGFGKKAVFTSQPFLGGYSIIKRSFVLAQKSITFEDGFYSEHNYSDLYKDNRLVIPLAIYGIKGVI